MKSTQETKANDSPVILKPTRLATYIILFSIGWTMVVAGSLRWNQLQVQESIHAIALNVSRAHFEKDFLFRKWNSMHNGVYVPLTEKTPANPHLKPNSNPERDITTPSGKKLTLINPAYMIRQIYELAQEDNRVAAHITSLTPIRKENKADLWERKALKSFQTGEKEQSTVALINGEKFVRMMRPLITEKSCLKCHTDQGLKVGDIRGGMSISIPMAPLENISKSQLRMLLLTHFFFWIIGLLTINLSFKTIKNRFRDRKMAAEKLERQKEHFRLFYERAPISYQALDADGRLLNVNTAWLAMLGYDRSEVEGRFFTDFIGPEHNNSFNQRYSHLKKEDSGTCYVELSLRSKDGGERFALLTGTIINDEEGNFKHTQCTLQDVTDRTRAEQNLEKLRRQQEQILNSAGEGIYGLDCDGITTFVNPAAARFLGWSQEELIGKPHHTMVHYAKPDGSPYPLAECPIHAAIRDGQLHHGIGEFFWRRDGSQFPAEYTSTPIIEDGSIKGAVVVFNDISASHEAEIALREQRNLFETILASTSDLIALKNRDAVYLAVNAAFCKNIGKNEDEIIGKTDVDLFSAEAAAVYQKEDDEVMSSVQPCFHDMKITKEAQGESQWLHITKTPVVDDQGDCIGLLCSIHDITDRKQAEEILENNEARFRGLFNNMNSGAAVFKTTDNGKKFTVVDFNQAAERIEKLEKEQVLGKDITDIFPNIQELGLTNILQTVWRTGLPEHSPPTFYQDERISGWREHHIYKLPSGELVALFDDVTLRKQVEEELRQAQKMEAIGTLAGGIAHDFNNILTAIIGYTQLMLYDAPSENKNYPLLKEVLNASKRATNLVNQILTFSRQTEKERKPIEIQPVIKEALKLLRGTLPTTIEIIQEIGANCRMVMADPVQVHQIFMNLCTNAYHAMRKDGGTLTIRMDETTIAPGFTDVQDHELTPGSYLRLAIHDSGTGMDEETKAKIFAPYFTTKGKSEGTGLGLSTVLGLARSYNGGVTVKSTPDQGSVFTVYLPIIAQEESRDADEESGATQHISARILFVDDEETIVRLGKITLERLGCEVTALSSGVDALALFKQNPQRFDMVITDQTMPGLTGAALSRHILAIRPELPIIMATGYSETINAEQAEEIGIRELLMKPLDLHDFERVIIRNLPPKV